MPERPTRIDLRRSIEEVGKSLPAQPGVTPGELRKLFRRWAQASVYASDRFDAAIKASSEQTGIPTSFYWHPVKSPPFDFDTAWSTTSVSIFKHKVEYDPLPQGSNPIGALERRRLPLSQFPKGAAKTKEELQAYLLQNGERIIEDINPSVAESRGDEDFLHICRTVEGKLTGSASASGEKDEDND